MELFSQINRLQVIHRDWLIHDRCILRLLILHRHMISLCSNRACTPMNHLLFNRVRISKSTLSYAPVGVKATTASIKHLLLLSI